jgi:hypothetical protein
VAVGIGVAGVVVGVGGSFRGFGLWCRGRRRALGQVLREVERRALDAVEAEGLEVPRQPVREPW